MIGGKTDRMVYNLQARNYYSLLCCRRHRRSLYVMTFHYGRYYNLNMRTDWQTAVLVIGKLHYSFTEACHI